MGIRKFPAAFLGCVVLGKNVEFLGPALWGRGLEVSSDMISVRVDELNRKRR